MSKFRRQLMMASMGEPVPPTPPPTPYIEWLKSLGCVTWLPLTEGDLEDKITETTLTLSGNGSMTWDSSVGMYKIAVPSTQGQYVAKLDNGFSASMFPTDTISILAKFRKVTSSTMTFKEQPCLISSNPDTLGVLTAALYNGTSKSSTIPSGIHYFVKTFSDTERIFYYDGAVNGTYAAYANHLPSNWVVSSNGLYIGYRTGNNVTYYLADYYIFNKVLSMSTIRQIQGFDPLPPNVIK